MNSKEFTEMALSFPGAIPQPHFNRTAFKVVTKRIFATLDEENELANIKLSKTEQRAFCSINKDIYPVPNKWGGQGWTTFEIKKTETPVILDALSSAYNDIFKNQNKKK